jgi:hypothetical protein
MSVDRFREGDVSGSFKDVEMAFRSLRTQFREKAISRREFIDQLKKLRLRDSQGRFWMIGAQSGKWYYFDGRDWVPSDPPIESSGRAKCLSCGLDNEPGADTCARCGESLKEREAFCPGCGMPLENPGQKCPSCSQETGASPLDEEVLLKIPKEDIVLRRLSPSSFFFFSGGTGLVLGIILGAFAGASDFFSGMAQSLPDSLGTLQGTLMGGIVFAVLGGLLGFVLLGAIGYLQAHLFNGVSAIVGGLRVTLDHLREKEKGSR